MEFNQEVRKATDPIYQKISKVMPEIEWSVHAPYIHKINKLKNKLFGIECNFEELNGIDFKKGCYVGQENTARIKLKNKLSKRLLPVEIIDGKLDEDETVYCNQIEIGKILINEEYPFALIKFSNENFNKELTLKSKNGSFKIFIPEWLKI